MHWNVVGSGAVTDNRGMQFHMKIVRFVATRIPRRCTSSNDHKFVSSATILNGIDWQNTNEPNQSLAASQSSNKMEITRTIWECGASKWNYFEQMNNLWNFLSIWIKWNETRRTLERRTILVCSSVRLCACVSARGQHWLNSRSHTVAHW